MLNYTQSVTRCGVSLLKYINVSNEIYMRVNYIGKVRINLKKKCTEELARGSKADEILNLQKREERALSM